MKPIYENNNFMIKTKLDNITELMRELAIRNNLK